MPATTIHPAHQRARTAMARRLANLLRGSWDARPVAGCSTVLHYAASLTEAGWTILAERSGEDVPSEGTRLEVLRELAGVHRRPERRDPFAVHERAQAERSVR